MSIRCIYCAQSKPTRGREHVYPDALGQHDWTLPLGAVCDACHRALNHLDQALVAHPHISTLLLLCGVPGKRGRARRRFGFLSRRDDDGLHLEVPPSRTLRTEVAGQQIFVHADAPAEFRAAYFRRGLYKIAFNLAAYELGVDAVLEPRFDPARQYVRAPKPRERWPYAQRVLPPDQPDFGVSFGRVRGTTGVAYSMELFGSVFMVDLLHPFLFAFLAPTRLQDDSVLVQA